LRVTFPNPSVQCTGVYFHKSIACSTDFSEWSSGRFSFSRDIRSYNCEKKNLLTMRREMNERFRFPRKMISWATRDEIECDRSVTNWLAEIFAREIKGRKRHTVYEQGNIINVLKHITICRMNFSTLKQI